MPGTSGHGAPWEKSPKVIEPVGLGWVAMPSATPDRSRSRAGKSFAGDGGFPASPTSRIPLHCARSNEVPIAAADFGCGSIHTSSFASNAATWPGSDLTSKAAVASAP